MNTDELDTDELDTDVRGDGDEHYLKLELEQRFGGDRVLLDFFSTATLNGVWYWNLEQPDDEWMSPDFWRLLGIDPATKRHSPAEWQDLIFPEDRDQALADFERHCADPNHPYDQVVRYRHADGSTVWVHCRGVALRDETGRPIRMLGVHLDITEAKRAEELLAQQVRELETARLRILSEAEHAEQLNQELAEANERLNMIVTGAGIGYWEWEAPSLDEGEDGGVAIWNPTMYDIFDVDPETFTPSLASVGETIVAEDFEKVTEALNAHFEFGVPYDMVHRVITSNGDIKWVRATADSVRHEDGRPRRMVGSIVELSGHPDFFRQVESLSFAGDEA